MALDLRISVCVHGSSIPGTRAIKNRSMFHIRSFDRDYIFMVLL